VSKATLRFSKDRHLEGKVKPPGFEVKTLGAWEWAVSSQAQQL
jgi:hypothetical protein